MAKGSVLLSAILGGAVGVAIGAFLWRESAASQTTAPRSGAEPATSRGRSDTRGSEAEEVAALRAEVARLKHLLAAARDEVSSPAVQGESSAHDAIARCALDFNDDRCPSPATQEVLDYRASCGIVVSLQPPSFTESGRGSLSELSEEIGLDPAEADLISEITDAVQKTIRQGFTRAYTDLGGDEAAVADVSIEELKGAVRGLAADRSRGAADKVASLTASIVAGHRDRPREGELSPLEYAEYLDVDGGYIYDELLRLEIGRVRAREIREALNNYQPELRGTAECP